MFDKLKEKKEKRGKLVEEMESLFDSAEKETRDLKPEEEKRYEEIETELTSLDEEIKKLEKMEDRQKQLAAEKAKREEEARTATGNENKNPDVKVTANNLKTPEARNAKIFSMLQGNAVNDADMIREARKSLVEGGWYDDIKEERAFQTLTDTKGGILIPSSVSSDIINIAQEYGAVLPNSLNLGNIIQNELKVPQILGRPTFSAVNQRAAIPGSGLNLGGIALKANKWGCIVDWTNEVDESIGSVLMPILFRQIAEGWAFVVDDAFFNGDGTSSYNNIKGLETLEGTVNYVQRTTADTGDASFATIDADDYNSAIYDIAPGCRSGAIWVMHPNMIEHLHNLQDGQGQYIYGKPSEVMPVGNLWGYRIVTSEAFPFTDAVSSTVAAFYNPRYLAYASGRSLTATMLSEGSITDEDSNTLNLATMDAKAIRWTGLFDLVLSTVTRTTEGTAQGAFSVLRTAAS